MIPCPPRSTLFPYTTLFRSGLRDHVVEQPLAELACLLEVLHVDALDDRQVFLCDLFLADRSEEHTSELQSHSDFVCRLLLEKKNTTRRWETCCVQQWLHPCL